jgi:hypothetical protein
LFENSVKRMRSRLSIEIEVSRQQQPPRAGFFST